MASGSYAKRQEPQEPLEIQSRVPLRATRELPETAVKEIETETGIFLPRSTVSKAVQVAGEKTRKKTGGLKGGGAKKATRVVSARVPHPLEKHRPWLTPLLICVALVVMGSAVLLSSSIMQRPSGPVLFNRGFGGQVYDVQVGGDQASTWQQNQPIDPKVPIKQGPYSVLTKPSLSVDFINQVLQSFNSPAVGKGQALTDMGVKYGIDPAYGLAFFLHESTMGTQGEARTTLSLGNLRCIPNAKCIDQDRGGYAAFPSWEAGFEAWYKLIRNYYIAQRGLVTVDQIIPVYAPNADNNNEQGYISALKHYIDTWHAGQLRP